MRFNEHFNYDPETGKLTWKKKPSNNSFIKVGNSAGCPDREGYILVGFQNRIYKAHRICWLLYRGHWPLETIHHENHITDDNRISNLRSVSHGENNLNKKKVGPGKLPYPRIYKTRHNTYAVYHIDSCRKYLGTVKTLEAALKKQAASR